MRLRLTDKGKAGVWVPACGVAHRVDMTQEGRVTCTACLEYLTQMRKRSEKDTVN